MLWQRILVALSQDIQSGRLEPGDWLPTHRDLAGTLGVTINTVTKAFTEAERNGLVVGRVGHGTYVRTRSDKRLEAKSTRSVFSDWESFRDLASPTEAAEFLASTYGKGAARAARQCAMHAKADNRSEDYKFWMAVLEILDQ